MCKLFRCVIYICFVVTFLFSGKLYAATYQQASKLNFTNLIKKEKFFSNSVNFAGKKIVFQKKILNPKDGLIPVGILDYRKEKWKIPIKNRIDLFMTNIDGTEELNLTALLHAGELAFFLFPCWSMDRTELAFIAYANIQPEEISRSSHVVHYDIEVYVFNDKTKKVQKVFSTSKKYNVPSGSLYLLRPAWSGYVSADAKQLPVIFKQIDFPQSIPGYPLMLVPVVDNYLNRFTHSASFDGKFKVVNEEEVKEFGPKVPVYNLMADHPWKMDYFLGTFRTLGLLVTLKQKIAICEGKIDVVQWDLNNSYVLIFNKLEGRFYIVNPNGEAVDFNGYYPAVQ